MHEAVSSAAETMDRMYRYQRFIYDLTRKYYLLGRDSLISRLDAKPDARILEIGCGTARNLILAAKCFPDSEFFGVDISQEMLVTAKHNITREKLDDAITLACADAASFDPKSLFGIERFDRIFISYSLSMIPAWRHAIERAVAILAAQGELHVVDFGDQRGLPRFFARGLTKWLKRFHVTPRMDLEIQLRTLAELHAGNLHFTRPYRGYAQYAVMRLAAAA